MKCYELHWDGELTEGFAIDCEAGLPACVKLIREYFVQLPKGVSSTLQFSCELSRRHEDATDGGRFETSRRLIRCDAEKRAEVWLLPEGESAKNDALILCSGLLPKRRKEPRLSWDLPESRVFFDCEIVSTGRWTGRIALVQLPPGASITVFRFNSGGWWWTPPVPVRFKVQADGTLSPIGS